MHGVGTVVDADQFVEHEQTVADVFGFQFQFFVLGDHFEQLEVELLVGGVRLASRANVGSLAAVRWVVLAGDIFVAAGDHEGRHEDGEGVEDEAGVTAVAVEDEHPRGEEHPLTLLAIDHEHVAVLLDELERQHHFAVVLERTQQLALGDADLVLDELHLGFVVGFVAAVNLADDVVEGTAEVPNAAVEVLELAGQ